jgi:chemotaxis protein CheZ
MPVRRKVFRIEETHLENAQGGTREVNSDGERQEVLRELKALRELIARKPREADSPDAARVGANGLRALKDETDSIRRAISHTKQEIAALHLNGFSGCDYGRVFRELDAVMGGAGHAIEQILATAEDIDEAANTLSAILKGERDQALAQDIRDQVARIFEACNFHDLAGQRITKVMATLKFIEERVARMMAIWGGVETFQDRTGALYAQPKGTVLMNGPKLDGDPGHASQDDIDRLFG